MREEKGSREGRTVRGVGTGAGGREGREGARRQKVSLLLVVLWLFSLSYLGTACCGFAGLSGKEGIPGCGIFLSFILGGFHTFSLKLSFILH